MNVDPLAESLAGFPNMLRAVVRPCSDEMLRWPPSLGKWSIVEVVGHLFDKEGLDFPVRLRRLLEDPNMDWDRINPPAKVIANRHSEANVEVLLSAFEEERRRTLAWLRTQTNAEWNKKKVKEGFPS